MNIVQANRGYLSHIKRSLLFMVFALVIYPTVCSAYTNAGVNTIQKGYMISTDTEMTVDFTGTNFKDTSCYVLRGNTANPIFVPTRTEAEWLKFYDWAMNPNNGVTIVPSNWYTKSPGVCWAGTATSVIGDGPWTCTGGAKTSPTCTANIIIDGVCGSSDGATFSTSPTTGFCSAGDKTDIYGLGPWSWSCLGKNGGKAKNCSANTSVITCPYGSVVSGNSCISCPSGESSGNTCIPVSNNVTCNGSCIYWPSSGLLVCGYQCPGTFIALRYTGCTNGYSYVYVPQDVANGSLGSPLYFDPNGHYPDMPEDRSKCPSGANGDFTYPWVNRWY